MLSMLPPDGLSATIHAMLGTDLMPLVVWALSLHFDPTLNIGTLFEIAAILGGIVAFLRHAYRLELRVDSLWRAFHGDGEQDKEAWFPRLTIMESKVDALWERRSAPRGTPRT